MFFVCFSTCTSIHISLLDLSQTTTQKINITLHFSFQFNRSYDASQDLFFIESDETIHSQSDAYDSDETLPPDTFTASQKHSLDHVDIQLNSSPVCTTVTEGMHYCWFFYAAVRFTNVHFRRTFLWNCAAEWFDIWYTCSFMVVNCTASALFRSISLLPV